jgi:predicted O-methyltransferase YrrM
VQLSILRRMLGRVELPRLPLNGASDARWSVISSAHDIVGQPTDDLIELALAAGHRARTLRLHDLEHRCREEDALWIRTWPGEHYRYLAALAELLEPATAVEVGTYKGQGTLALAAGSSVTDVVTYDVLPWREFDGTALREEDFADGRVQQRIGDLGSPGYLREQADTLRRADLVFLDGPKSGGWEDHAVPAILSVLNDRRRLVVFDDIRLLPMVQLWRDLPFPKFDATSLGHWSGTGLLFTSSD